MRKWAVLPLAAALGACASVQIAMRTNLPRDCREEARQMAELWYSATTFEEAEQACLARPLNAEEQQFAEAQARRQTEEQRQRAAHARVAALRGRRAREHQARLEEQARRAEEAAQQERQTQEPPPAPAPVPTSPAPQNTPPPNAPRPAEPVWWQADLNTRARQCGPSESPANYVSNLRTLGINPRILNEVDPHTGQVINTRIILPNDILNQIYFRDRERCQNFLTGLRSTEEEHRRYR
jgi:hypothetical protein